MKPDKKRYGPEAGKDGLPKFDGLPILKVDEAHGMSLRNLLGQPPAGTSLPAPPAVRPT